MGVRIFLTNGSGNQKIENNQQMIQMVLTTREIEFTTIDISAPGMQEMRSFMREKGRKKEGQRNVIPPQIFNGEEYRGDFEGFDIANEDDDLEEFLGIPRKNPKAEPIKTGAVASDVARIIPGKLERDGGKKLVGKETKYEDDKDEVNDKHCTNKEKGNICEDGKYAPKKEGEYGTDHDANNLANKTDCNESLDGEIQSVPSNTENADTENNNDHNDDSIAEISDIKEISLRNSVAEHENIVNEHIEKAHLKLNHDSDPIMINGITDMDDKYGNENNGLDDDSSDYCSSDEDNAVEYMPDGEIVRKKSRGFKQLSNCKRFWKASLMTA